ncbi:hypothetical protein D3C72_2089660 [compost metagenome]
MAITLARSMPRCSASFCRLGPLPARRSNTSRKNGALFSTAKRSVSAAGRRAMAASSTSGSSIIISLMKDMRGSMSATRRYDSGMRERCESATV